MSPKDISSKKYYFESLGCAKNTVDGDSIIQILDHAGYQRMAHPFEAQFLIVNTCGFIEPARKESINALQILAQKKKKHQFLIATGCLPDRSRDLILQEVEGMDGMLSTRRWMDILSLIDELQTRQEKPIYHIPESASIGSDEPGVLRASKQGGSAYLKIADGCRRPCAFCSIPLIKGTAVSRPPEIIVDEALQLQARGVQELILIAQDTTDYGSDLGLKVGLAGLLEKITSEAQEIPWIRVLYAYPGFVTDKLIETMRDHHQILPYLDMPLQHACPETLRRMHRPSNMDWVRSTIKKMREVLPGLALRSTFIVGYPGETEHEFQVLMDFLQEIRFDHVGVFPFSFEPGTASESLGDPIPWEIKQERLERLMILQEKISLENNETFIGRELDILVEGYDNGLSVGRSYRDAPEIDGLVIIDGNAQVGKLTKVQITGALTHDLTGILIK